MNTRQIDYILELAKTLNFNRAAENLFITQPTLTYQIKAVEEEIGFQIFLRNAGTGAALTSAGRQFCKALRNIREDLKFAIEQGQNVSARYDENLTIGIPFRSAVRFLPEIISKFESTHDKISVTPEFIPLASCGKFLKGQQDFLFAREEDMKHVPNIVVHKLFDDGIYLITRNDDPLAEKNLITMEDLRGKILMVGGGSQPELQTVQRRVINTLGIKYFNSNDRETTLINVAAGKGICLAPGFLNDHNNEFAWTPFDCEEKISCVICTHAGDDRKSVKDFLKIVKRFYKD